MASFLILKNPQFYVTILSVRISIIWIYHWDWYNFLNMISHSNDDICVNHLLTVGCSKVSYQILMLSNKKKTKQCFYVTSLTVLIVLVNTRTMSTIKFCDVTELLGISWRQTNIKSRETRLPIATDGRCCCLQIGV